MASPTALRGPLFAALLYVSEGRAASTLESIRRAGTGHPPAKVVHTFYDHPYNRSGYTLAGPGPPLRDALCAMARTAFSLLDMSRHSGTHPRLGVVDHISVHPLKDASLEEAGEFARSLGTVLARSEEVPVFLYGAASEHGRTLADIRRSLGYFKPTSESSWVGHLPASCPLPPDLGPSIIPQAKGLLTLGAVPWIVNYNVPVRGTDLETCKGLARQVSERGGGLQCVQAMALEHDGELEVACNILDADVTPAESVLAFLQSAGERLEKPPEVCPGYFPGITPERVIASLSET